MPAQHEIHQEGDERKHEQNFRYPAQIAGDDVAPAGLLLNSDGLLVIGGIARQDVFGGLLDLLRLLAETHHHVLDAT